MILQDKAALTYLHYWIYEVGPLLDTFRTKIVELNGLNFMENIQISIKMNDSYAAMT